MKIIDIWKLDGKTAIYCDDVETVDINNKKVVVINKKEYDIAGYDILKSISGRKNLMILLNTNESFKISDKITVS